jgi:hypothetical protein
MEAIVIIIGAVFLIILVIWFSYVVVAYTHRNLWLLIDANRLRFVRSGLLVVAGTIGIVFASVSWQLSTNESASGFPFPWNIWYHSTLEPNRSMSPLLLIPWATDLILGSALPHLPLAILCVVTRRTAGDALLDAPHNKSLDRSHGKRVSHQA